jgi:hypothetical protein
MRAIPMTGSATSTITFGLPKDEPPLQATEISASWRAAWLRAIATAWQSQQKAQEKTHAGAMKPAVLTKPAAALADEGFNFEGFFGDLLTIEVKDYTGPKRFNPALHEVRGGARTNGWSHFGDDLQAKLTLVLPPKPNDAADFAVALADYDAGGRVYPFTIC